MPKYPIYIPSKGRAKSCLSANFLRAENIPFKLVVEPQDSESYSAEFGADNILILPVDNPGSVVTALNFIKTHSTNSGHIRHWQLDDNIHSIIRASKGKPIPTTAEFSLSTVEEFIDRYENIAIAGLCHTAFGLTKSVPFQLNQQVYSCVCLLNSVPFMYRELIEDTDYCLQVLSAGWCTVLINAFLIKKATTQTMKGGNTDTIYKDDGRIIRARKMQKAWPRAIKVQRRFDVPRVITNGIWKKFTTQLKPKNV